MNKATADGGGPGPGASADNGPGIALRAILVGTACSFCLSAGAACAIMYLRGSYMALGTSMPGAVFLLFCLTFLINRFLKFIHPRAGLNRRAGDPVGSLAVVLPGLDPASMVHVP